MMPTSGKPQINIFFFFFFFLFSLLKKNKEMSKEENTKQEEEEAEEEEIFCCHWLWLYTSVESCDANMISWLLLCCLFRPACSHLRHGHSSNVCVILPTQATPLSAAWNLQSPDTHRNSWVFPHRHINTHTHSNEAWTLRGRTKGRWEKRDYAWM